MNEKYNYTPLSKPTPISEQQWPEGTLPIVSICCQTYNHKDFIEEALESFLMQKTDFPIEILLRDDASIDRTAEICKEYARKYPDIVKLLMYEENQWQKGVRPFIDNVKRAKGKYIAFCEGDDYWTDPLKLQKQVDFLEKNEDCIYVFHKVEELKDGKIKIDELNAKNKSKFEFNDVFSNNYAHSTSIVYRATDLSKFPPFYLTAIPGDHVLQIMLLKDGGYAYFMEDVMAVYRQHDGGVWSADSGAKFWVERAITNINLNNYFNRKNFSDCFPLADHIANNGFKKISFSEYYKKAFSQMNFFDIFNPKNKYLLFPWVYYLIKK